MHVFLDMDTESIWRWTNSTNEITEFKILDIYISVTFQQADLDMSVANADFKWYILQHNGLYVVKALFDYNNFFIDTPKTIQHPRRRAMLPCAKQMHSQLKWYLGSRRKASISVLYV
jgi:hypothetical protein